MAGQEKWRCGIFRPSCPLNEVPCGNNAIAQLPRHLTMGPIQQVLAVNCDHDIQNALVCRRMFGPLEEAAIWGGVAMRNSMPRTRLPLEVKWEILPAPDRDWREELDLRGRERLASLCTFTVSQYNPTMLFTLSRARRT